MTEEAFFGGLIIGTLWGGRRLTEPAPLDGAWAAALRLRE